MNLIAMVILAPTLGWLVPNRRHLYTALAAIWFLILPFQTYNVLVNPNNPLTQGVLAHMLDCGQYFFFALNPDNRLTAFRADIGQETLIGLGDNLARIERSTTPRPIPPGCEALCR